MVDVGVVVNALDGVEPPLWKAYREARSLGGVVQVDP